MRKFVLLLCLTLCFSTNATDLKVGDLAPNFNLQATNGDFYQLSDYQENKQ